MHLVASQIHFSAGDKHVAELVGVLDMPKVRQ
jgi:hypothetical protein